MTLLNGDCREILPKLTDGAFDLILTDPPYGTMSDFGKGTQRHHKGEFDWDTAIPPDFIFREAERLLKPSGRLVLFSAEPYSSKLIQERTYGMTFVQRAIWLKPHFSNALSSKQALLRLFEDILIFTKYDREADYVRFHPLADWFYSEFKKTGFGKKKFSEILGNGMAGHYFTRGLEFCFPTRENFEKLQTTGFFKRDYEELLRIHREFLAQRGRATTKPTFNIPEGRAFNSDVFEYARPAPSESVHPTQKPVPLLRELIRIYSNPGGRVLDFTMGSGSTGCACIEEDREFYGIERDPRFFEIARNRCEKAEISRRSRLF